MRLMVERENKLQDKMGGSREKELEKLWRMFIVLHTSYFWTQFRFVVHCISRR